MSFNHKRRLKHPEIPFTEQQGKGTVVRSRTGRNRGKVFLVTGFFKKDDKLYAYIVDGEKRTIQSPKLKSASHLETVAVCSDLVKEKIADKTLKNEDVKKLIVETVNFWRD